MPDFERIARSLELHLAETTEQVAYVRGKHAGENRARKQVAVLVAVIAVLAVIASCFFK